MISSRIFILLFLLIANSCLEKKTKSFVKDIQGVFIYSKPELSSTILSRALYREEINLIGELENGWIKIEYQVWKGFAYLPNVSESDPEAKFYVDNLEGAEFYNSSEDKREIIALLPHKSEIKVLGTYIQADKFLNGKIEWVRGEAQGMKGFLRLETLSPVPRSHFFAVVAPRVYLMSKPNFKSGALLGVPQNTIGEMLEKSGDIVSYRGTKGYWFKTIYNNKSGWIFSGFTVISTDKAYLEDRDYIRNEEWFLRYLEKASPVEVFSGELKVGDSGAIEKTEVAGYTVLSVKYGNPEDDCLVETNSRVVFINNKTKQSYSIQGLYSEDLVSIDKPFSGTVYTSYNGCNCCCPDTGNLLYFLLEDRVFYIHHKSENIKGFCYYGPSEGLELERENRYDASSKTILMNLKLPVCEPPESQEIFKKDPIDFPHTLFAVLKVEQDKIIIDRFYDRGIPEKYRKLWETASK
ncbi:MAG: SH3 domain-containing protein [Leptospiraceae bacterium]|nr:SH3 domain-containing protein [Leptospiraceae bacterium]